LQSNASRFRQGGNLDSLVIIMQQPKGIGIKGIPNEVFPSGRISNSFSS
jgi:hypothetical protein